MKVPKESKSPIVDGCPQICTTCQATLCLRQQVINLALNGSESMHCLNCLGKEFNQGSDKVLSRLKVHIKARKCFAKEWMRYPNISCCPAPDRCFPKLCFD